MATNKTQAAKLLNAAEMEVFNASLAPAIKDLSAVRLAGKVKRSRTLRDKFRDLLQRQTVATRRSTGTKIGSSGNANERTAKKAQVFDEVLQRFSTRLEQVQAAAAREAARTAKAASARAAKKSLRETPASSSATSTVKAAVRKAVAKKAARKTAARHVPGEPPPRSAKAPAVAPGAAGTGVGPGSQRARVAAKDARRVAARERPIQGYLSSAVRRAQSKRDGRG